MSDLPNDIRHPHRSGDGESSTGDRLTINGDVHFTPNDIGELRKLADSHPELAAQITADRRQIAISDQRTERLGMILAVVFGSVLIVGTGWTLVQLGWWQSIMFVAALLGISHILRVLLKGEFSDTSWFGNIMSGVSGKQPNSADSSDKD